jgi:Alw26I/Eco31I/Esp3I family type II restriction endonuclease
MRKEILVTNYNPQKLKELRQIAEVTFDMLVDDESIDVEELINLEEAIQPIPINIFYLAYLYVIYKNTAELKGVQKFPSLTSDLMEPHPKGLEYQEAMANHKNYNGIPVNRKNNNQIKWVTTVKTEEGQQRIKFWEKKRIELGIEAKSVLDAGIRQKVAVANHPTKKHVCLFSGSELYIDYRYLSPSKVDQINKVYNYEFRYYELDVFETSEILFWDDKCIKFSKIMGILQEFDSLDNLKRILKYEYVEKEYSPYVSPGVMSNSPDRFDGFHSYNADVREITDTGRFKDNLKKYSQDRRVYEMWSGGNWKMADRLYATFVKNKISPDHIGPMSLGFAHRPKFHPMTANQNSSKGNRMSYNDVQVLLEDERMGESVITLHSKYIWDKFKNRINNDSDAIKLSYLMRVNLHHVLIIFSMIKEKGHNSFLMRFLNPQFSYFDYEFIGFNPIDGTYQNVNIKTLNGKNQQNNAERYVRKAFQKLDEYIDKTNRKNKKWHSSDVDRKIEILMEFLALKDFETSEKHLYKVFEILANEAEINW